MVFTNQLLNTVLLHQGRAAHYHPMLSAVVVHLQRQAGAGFYRDPFHLPAASFGNSCVMAPGAVNLAVRLALWAASCFQLLHHSFDVLGFGAIRNQHCVVGFHDYEVFNSQTHYQAVFAAQIAVAAVFGDHVALEDIPIGILVF